jgi:hypothetical protein
MLCIKLPRPLTSYILPKPPNLLFLSLYTVTTPLAGQPRDSGSTPDRRKVFFSSLHRPDKLSTHLPPHAMCSKGSFLSLTFLYFFFIYFLLPYYFTLIHPSFVLDLLYPHLLSLPFLGGTCVTLSVTCCLFHPAPIPTDTLIDPNSY